MAVLTIEYTSKAWKPDVSGRLVAEDGTVLYHHISSSLDWLRQDLTSNFGRAAKLAESYPEGVQIVMKNLDEQAVQSGDDREAT